MYIATLIIIYKIIIIRSRLIIHKMQAMTSPWALAFVLTSVISFSSTNWKVPEIWPFSSTNWKVPEIWSETIDG